MIAYLSSADANHVLRQLKFDGASSVAMIYENYGNEFFFGLGSEAERYAHERGLQVLHSAQLTRPADSSAFNESQLKASVAAAARSKADILVLACRLPEFQMVLRTVKDYRRHIVAGALQDIQGENIGGHAFRVRLALVHYCLLPILS